MPWGLIFDIALRLIKFAITSQEQRDRMKLQMYEFARRFDIDAVEKNAKHREEYRSLKDALAQKIREKESGIG